MGLWVQVRQVGARPARSLTSTASLPGEAEDPEEGHAGAHGLSRRSAHYSAGTLIVIAVAAIDDLPVSAISWSRAIARAICGLAPAQAPLEQSL